MNEIYILYHLDQDYDYTNFKIIAASYNEKILEDKKKKFIEISDIFSKKMEEYRKQQDKYYKKIHKKVYDFLKTNERIIKKLKYCTMEENIKEVSKNEYYLFRKGKKLSKDEKQILKNHGICFEKEETTWENSGWGLSAEFWNKEKEKEEVFENIECWDDEFTLKPPETNNSFLYGNFKIEKIEIL